MCTDLMPVLRYLRAVHELLDWAPRHVLPARQVRHLVYKWKIKTTATASGRSASAVFSETTGSGQGDPAA